MATWTNYFPWRCDEKNAFRERLLADVWSDVVLVQKTLQVFATRGSTNCTKDELGKDLIAMSEQKRCEVDGTVLKSMKVRVIYGSPLQTDNFKALVEAPAELFPNAQSHVLGGCTLGGIGPDYEALVCSECRKAEKKWKARSGLPTQPQIGGFFISGPMREL